MSPDSEARKIYRAIEGNAAATAAIRAEYSALAISRSTDANGSAQMTSGTMNGQTFSMNHGISSGTRFYVLSQVCKWLDIGGVTSSQTIVNLS